MNKRLVSHVLVVALLLVLTISGVHAQNAKLSSADGEILGTGIWVDPGEVTLEYWVSQNLDMTWNYTYELIISTGIQDADISHMILEVSEDFGPSDIFNIQVLTGECGSTEISWFGPEVGNPGMPYEFQGIKFDDVSGMTFKVTFDSLRMPMWGSFYAKDGAVGDDWNAAWNAPDHKILVPDTIIPEPASLLVLGSGLGAMFLRRRKSSGGR